MPSRCSSSGAIKDDRAQVRPFLFLPFVIHERWLNQDETLYKQRNALLPFSAKSITVTAAANFMPALCGIPNKSIKRNWAPLWTLYSTSDDGAGTFERRVCWRLYHSRRIEGLARNAKSISSSPLRKAVDGKQTFGLLGLEW
jgi:hypothetical protein